MREDHSTEISGPVRSSFSFLPFNSHWEATLSSARLTKNWRASARAITFSAIIALLCGFTAFASAVSAAVPAGAKKVIIDTDPGTDDAVAIMLALNSPELDVRALTVVPGNVVAAAGT